MSEMYNECREYAKRIAEEIEDYYNGTTNEDGEEVSLYDYFADALDYEVILTSQKTIKKCSVICNTGWPYLLDRYRRSRRYLPLGRKSSRISY